MEATHVVDGLALLKLYQAASIPFGRKKLPASEQRPITVRCSRSSRALEAALDALRDALTAESVYHLVQGNPVRAGASLDAIARSEVPPPELEFGRTPRSGVAVAHRVVVLWNAPVTAPAAWPNDARQVRAGLEPLLNAWAARTLGDPQEIRCDVRFEDPESGGLLVTRELRMQDTGARAARPSRARGRIRRAQARTRALFRGSLARVAAREHAVRRGGKALVRSPARLDGHGCEASPRCSRSPSDQRFAR